MIIVENILPLYTCGGNIPWSCVRCHRKTKGRTSHARARGFLCHICRNERNRRYWK